MNILCVSMLSEQTPSGVITYIRNLRRYFQDNSDIHITFASIDDTPWFWARIAGLVRRIIHILSFGNPAMIEYSFDVKARILVWFALRRFRKGSYDLIHAQDILSGYTAKTVFKGKIPLVLTCHFNDSPVEENMLMYHLPETARLSQVRRYTRRFSQVDQFVYVAGYTVSTSRYLLQEDANITVIYNGLDFSHPLHPDAGKDAFFSILNTGHVEARKNQKLFIPIAKELIRQNFRDFRITLVGTGPDLEELKGSVAREGLASWFRFAGWSDNIPAYLAVADLYIHTSINDICPYSVMEAVASGIPALALRVGGLPEMLPEDCLFAVNDYQAIASWLVENVDKLPAIAERQYRQARPDFSYTNQVEKLTDVYYHATGRTNPSRQPGPLSSKMVTA